MLLAKERTAQKKQEKRGGRTDKGTFICYQLPDVLTFVVRLRSREKGEKEEYLAMGRGKTAHTNQRVFWKDSKLLTGSL